MRVEGLALSDLAGLDLPLNFHPAVIREPAFYDTPNGAVLATGENA